MAVAIHLIYLPELVDADYLAYALIDSVVDSYNYILDKVDKDMEALDDDLATHTERNHLPQIHSINRNLLTIRRSVHPLKEMVYQFSKGDSKLIQPSSKIFLRDLMDHANRMVSQIATDRDFLSDLINTNATNLNGKLNQTLKVLAVISTIFSPLTFIVGVYGMNFDHMPELHGQYSYFIVWGIMIVIVIIQFIIFKRNKWI